jgi:hypothetical protein
MASIYQLMFDQAVAKEALPDQRVIIMVFWEPGEGAFQADFTPPQEFWTTVGDMRGEFVPPVSRLREMIVVNTDVLNVRPEPNTDKPRIDSLYRGDRVKVRGEGDWLELVEVNQKPRTGYVAARFLKAV